MKENPKVFYDHVRRQKEKVSKIGPFQIDEEYLYDSVKYANCWFNRNK